MASVGKKSWYEKYEPVDGERLQALADGSAHCNDETQQIVRELIEARRKIRSFSEDKQEKCGRVEVNVSVNLFPD